VFLRIVTAGPSALDGSRRADGVALHGTRRLDARGREETHDEFGLLYEIEVPRP